MKTAYTMVPGIKFKALELIDVKALERATKDQWTNQTLCEVNDSVVRLGVLKGEFHWHKHDREDEFFLVLEGELEIEVEGRDPFLLGPQQGVTIPRGAIPRPRARKRTVILMAEPAPVQPTGD